MRLMVYSHDTFGLGNIRRMLAICSHLHASIPDLSILIVSGSPMLQSFRVAQGIDYIKLPCLKRTEGGELGVRFLDLDVAEIVRLRRELILSTAVSFRPDIVLVDKKPDGLAGELEPSLRYIRCNLPQTRILLVLRDILDSPRATMDAWEQRGYYSTLQWYYDDVLVLGDRQIYDVCKEYQFPESLRQKVHFCGYVSRQLPTRSRSEIRKELSVADDESLVLVTAGGGQDGYDLLSMAVAATSSLAKRIRVRTLLVTGPELGKEQTKAIYKAARSHAELQVIEFTDDLMSYMNAADTVVSMAGYKHRLRTPNARQKIRLGSACQARRRTEDSCRADGEFRRVQNHSSRCTHTGCPGKRNRQAVTGSERQCPVIHAHRSGCTSLHHHDVKSRRAEFRL